MTMKKSFLFLALLFPAPAAPAQQPAPERPNIILFLVDDMGWQDTSVPFWDSLTNANKEFYTPNMERLAARSLKFTDAHAASICTPSRVSLMSGMNAAHHRVTNWTMYRDKTVDAPDSLLDLPDWNVNGLSPVPGQPHSIYVTPLPRLLKAAGYFTIHCGKAHFGAYQTPGADPLRLGFSVNIGGSAAGNPASYLGEQNYGHVPGKFVLRAVPGLEKYWGTPTFLTEALTREALHVLDTVRLRKQPFFLYMAQYAVHIPYNPDARFYEKYRQRGLAGPEAAYAALVEGMDKSLGDLMDYLDEHGLADNTIILFMSDNGGFSRAPRSGPQDSQNYPLRDGKGSLYEGGTREPMMVCWPGVTRPGSVARQYVMIEDFFPSILEMAGVENYHTIQTVDGRSFVPVLKDAAYADSTRILVWNFPNKWVRHDARDVSWCSALRQGRWKLIWFQKTGSLELYDLEADISERHDLSARYPEKTRALSALLTRQLKAWHAQRPAYKATGNPVPWPDGTP
ncbi:sulfatase [Compostibacter hankyongensis]|uniref:Sulfatase n=1 Tax=Compostibacter hankyongensis TaxID=1007089 RepID=A0ABP8FBY8_9BACT